MPLGNFTQVTENDVVWTFWCNAATTNSTTAVTDTWTHWCGDTAGTASSTTGLITGVMSETVWIQWCNDGTPAKVHRTPPRPVPRPPTAEEIAASNRLAEVSRQRQIDERALRLLAEEKARKLLIENLSLRQRLEFEQHGHFVVEGQDNRYRIRKGFSGNIDVVRRDGLIGHRLCAHPREQVPDYDNMLIQKLMLEDDESKFLRLAYTHEYVGPSPRAPVLEALH